MPDYPLVWVDEVVGGDPPSTADPSAGAGAAAVPSSGSDFSSGQSLPSGATAPSTTGSTMTPEEAEAKITAMYADPNSGLNKGDPEAVDEILRLTRLAHPDPTPDELPPRELTEADLPRLSLPPETPAEDPDVKALQAITAHAGLDANTVQGAIDTVVRLAKEPIPDDPAELDAIMERDGARAIHAAREKYGRNYETTREHVAMGKAILRAEAPQVFALIHSHPSMLNSMEIFEALARLGARSREYHVSRFGTGRAPRS